MSPHVLVCGISTRAAAESAARAGYRVTAIDAYADLDQHPSVRALSLPRDYGRSFTAAATARAARGIDGDAVAYLSPFENHPSAVAALARGRRLWGNPPEVLRRVRDPIAVATALRARGFAVPEVCLPMAASSAIRPGVAPGPAGGRGAGVRSREGDPNPDPNPDPDPDPGADPDADRDRDARAWAMKPFRSGGGRRVRRWRGQRVARGCYLQQWIAGTPASVVFVAAGGAAVPLGISRQLCGDAAFGAAGHRYCGSIMAADALGGDRELLVRACALAGAVAEEFGLAGVNGVDFIAASGVPHAIEVNPRWTASLELVELSFGLSVFAAHAASFEQQALPRFDAIAALSRAGAAGKAIVFAREDVVTGDTTAWREDGAVRDVPHAGEHIAAGSPVCTVLAEDATAGGCYQALVRRAGRVYEDLSAWRRAAPPS